MTVRWLESYMPPLIYQIPVAEDEAVAEALTGPEATEQRDSKQI